jgi:ATP-dependent DNA helicase RecQ
MALWENATTATPQEWRARLHERCRSGLTESRSASDRLALLRSLTRLQDGRTVLSDERLQLSTDELALLPRFGLALTQGGLAIRLADLTPDWAPPGFQDAERLDTSPRSIFCPGSPDAALLRNSPQSSSMNFFYFERMVSRPSDKRESDI